MDGTADCVCVCVCVYGFHLFLVNDPFNLPISYQSIPIEETHTFERIAGAAFIAEANDPLFSGR